MVKFSLDTITIVLNHSIMASKSMTKSLQLEAEKKSSAGKTYYIRAAAISLQLA